jgi:hypothetical protein
VLLDSVYRTFHDAKNRCQNPRNKDYASYGGRGIRFEFASVEQFRSVLGPRPVGCTLEREDNDGPYGPGNCRWATRKEQGRNRSVTHFVTARGKRQSVSAWAEETGVDEATIRWRVQHWPESRWFEPARPMRPRGSVVLLGLLGLLCAWLAGCASSRPLPPEPLLPTAARLAALLEATPGRPAPALRKRTDPDGVTLLVMPRIVLQGGAVRLRCLVDDAPDVRGAVRLALEGTRVTMVELPNSIEHTITIERLPCGKSVATCTVRRVGRPDVVLTQDVEVRGGVCDDGGGAK